MLGRILKLAIAVGNPFLVKKMSWDPYRIVEILSQSVKKVFSLHRRVAFLMRQPL